MSRQLDIAKEAIVKRKESVCVCECGHRHRPVLASLVIEPCPFCGEDAECNVGETCWVACAGGRDTCPANGVEGDDGVPTYSTARRAVAAWNKMCRAARAREDKPDANGLLPCPCGSAAELEETDAGWGCPTVRCSSDRCPLAAVIRYPWDDEDPNFASITEQWNWRCTLEERVTWKGWLEQRLEEP